MKHPSNTLHRLSEIPSCIWFLGIGSFFIDISSVLVFTFTPLYLFNVLGVSTLGIGVMEGVVSILSLLMRLISGLISDYFRVRRPIILFGYSFAFLSRILFVFLPSVGWIFVARVLDRIGHGFQSSTRAAYIADVAPPHLRGACYGLRQALGMFGSVTGAIIGLWVMRNNSQNYQLIFKILIIPSLIGLFILFTGVKEPLLPKRVGPHRQSFVEFKKALRLLKKPFWMLMLTLFIFSLGWYSDVFLILFTKNLGMETSQAPFIMLAMNTASTFSSYFSGAFSDKKGRSSYLRLAIVSAFIANVLFMVSSYSSSLWIAGVGSILWGTQTGIMHSISSIIIAELAPLKLRATAFGIFYILNGIALLLASIVCGWLSQLLGFFIAFLLSASLSILAFLIYKMDNYTDSPEGIA